MLLLSTVAWSMTAFPLPSNASTKNISLPKAFEKHSTALSINPSLASKEKLYFKAFVSIKRIRL